MAEYLTALDIANRACQHMGARQIVSFVEDSKAAVELNLAYDKLRAAELERNVWAFAIKRAALRPLDTTTMLLVPETWNAATIYFNGAIVDDGTGTFWVSTAASNLNKQPGVDDTWKSYFGPMTVSLYSSTTEYFNGELVYKTDGKGNLWTYVARVTGATTGSADPAVGTAYDATVSYQRNAVVSQNGFFYMSLFDGNLNNSPGTGVSGASTYPLWNINTNYAANAEVASAVNGKVYLSFVANNLGNEPSADLTGALWRWTGLYNPWTSSFVAGVGSTNWLRLGATLVDFNINYPLGSGPVSNSETRNAYRLPYRYVRRAPRDPKAGSTSYLGAPSGLSYTDWNIESGFIVSRDQGPLMLRYVANIRNVTDMTAQFCEAFAARLALECCESVTQSNGKLAAISAEYKKFIGEAITVNGIEVEAEEPAIDDYIQCRI